MIRKCARKRRVAAVAQLGGYHESGVSDHARTHAHTDDARTIIQHLQNAIVRQVVQLLDAVSAHKLRAKSAHTASVIAISSS
jgi:hypothetical protein